ncbi:hypothetical protein GCM10029992_51430 [Glycomyces albus]
MMSWLMTRRARTFIAGAIAITLAALGLVAASGSPGQAAITPGTWYSITSAHSGLKLDIAGNSTELEAELVQWSSTGASNQQFRFVDSGDGYFRIEARHSGLVLDVLGDSAENGATIGQWTDMDKANQQWSVTAHPDGAYSFINRNSGKALDLWGFSTRPGSRISQYTYTGSNAQKWNLTQVDDGSGGLQVTVDYGADAGAAEHVASGFLHGIDLTHPTQYLIDGLDVHSIRGADYRPDLPSLYDPALYDRVAATGANLQVGLYYYVTNPDHPDNGYWPGDGGDQDTWRQIVTDVYQEARQRDYEFDSWITWNEPDLQWNSPERPFTRYLEAHDVAYDTVKELDPEARVQAPELARYDFERLTQFLTYCKDNDCLPDVLAWHELTDSPTDVPGHLAQIRQWMADNGIDPMPVAITEYQGTSDFNPNAWHVGKNVRWLAQFERARPVGLESALWASWTPSPFSTEYEDDGTMVSLPRAAWWNYHAYGDMTGRMVEATSTSPSTVDALAAVDSGMHRSVALIGNQTSQTQHINLDLVGIPAELTRNGRAHVRVETMSNAATLTAPSPILDRDFTVQGGNATLELSLPADAAFRVDVLPATDQAPSMLLEAEDLDATATSGITYRTYNEVGASGGTATALEATADEQSVAYTVDVPTSGVYDLHAGLKSLDTRGIAQVYIDGEVVGGPLDEYGENRYYSTALGAVELSAGIHEVEFRVVAKHQDSGSRWFVIDYLELTSLST